MPNMLGEMRELVGRPDVRLMSLMDHTPGQRQFRDEGKLRDYYRGKSGKTDAELDVMFERRTAYQKAHAEPNLREVVAQAHARAIPLASHDDTTDENVADAIRDHVAVAEFPTTMQAARGLHQAGVGILMGAPNVVRGGSHSGNIAAVELAREGAIGHSIVRLRSLQPVNGGACNYLIACPRSTWLLPSAPSPSGRRKPSASMIAVRSRSASAPT